MSNFWGAVHASIAVPLKQGDNTRAGQPRPYGRLFVITEDYTLLYNKIRCLSKEASYFAMYNQLIIPYRCVDGARAVRVARVRDVDDARAPRNPRASR